MTTLDRRAADLQDLVQDILKQFQCVNAAADDGPHVELNMQELRVVEFLGQRGTADDATAGGASHGRRQLHDEHRR